MEKISNPNPRYHLSCLVRTASFSHPEYRGNPAIGLEKPTHPDVLTNHAVQFLDQVEAALTAKGFATNSMAFSSFEEEKSTLLTICKAFKLYFESDDYDIVVAGIYGLAGLNCVSTLQDLIQEGDWVTVNVDNPNIPSNVRKWLKS